MNDKISKLSDFPNSPPLFRTTELVWYVLSVTQTLLVLRFIFKLFSVNSPYIITSVIHNITNYILYPFTLVLGQSTDSSNIFEGTTLLAIITYWVMAITIIKLLSLGKPPLSRIEQARMLSIEKYSH